jgi:Ca2+-binding RTX toxin-like protein
MTELVGTAGDETLLGTSGDDTFVASGGTDRVWGGTGGTDTLVLSGQAAHYSVVANGNGSYTLTDMRDGSPDGTLVVRAIDVFTVQRWRPRLRHACARAGPGSIRQRG